MMEEDFDWSDGEKSKRIWQIKKEGDHSYVGRAGDVIGMAQGIVYGNVLSWNYVLALESEGTAWHIDATYDLTNLATLRDWPIAVVVVDIAWGTLLCTLVGGGSYLIGSWLR